MPSAFSLPAAAQLKSIPAVLARLLRHGRPRWLIRYHGGLGDHLLCTAIAREWRRRGQQGAWMMSDHAELFAGNPDFEAVVPENMRLLRWAQRLNIPVVDPTYTQTDAGHHRQERPPGPIIAEMCRRSGLTGEVELRPYLCLTDAERLAGRRVERQVPIISSGRAARYHHPTKEWYPERFQGVVDELRHEFNFVQLGQPSDPPLAGALDLRGQTSLRESAAILAESLLYVGTVGFLMHLARAVETRSVIIYGGRESPAETGYLANENLYSALVCAPCWLIDGCPYDMECMKIIGVDEVTAAVRRQANRTPAPLEVERVVIPSPAPA